ncbi:subtilisin-like protease SBT1.6 [Quercus lobata]|uniref:subtilisin-like protease SBT1.6 n=1 Tax=Quercus lobata TaxID=97700 RepID=UPI00124677FE|nr:subtilisin-like protease SBT1.6 [Quercus lobata]
MASPPLKQSEADTIGENPLVLAVFEARRCDLHTTRSPQFLGLRNQRGLWSNSDYGSNVIISLLDTEIWPERRSFFDRNLRTCWWVLGSLVGIVGFVVVVVGLIVDELGALLGFYSLDDLVWVWFRVGFPVFALVDAL